MADGSPLASDWRSDPAAVAAYVRSIEHCFVEIRGRGVQWSPADGARARSWFTVGIPLGTALRVLQARVRAYRYRHGESARLPMHLGWYEPALLEHARHVRRLGRDVDPLAADPDEPDASGATLTDLLDALPALVEAARHPALRYALEKAFATLDKGLHPTDEAVAAGDAFDATVPTPCRPLDVAEIDALLDRCRNQIVRTIQQGLDDAERAAQEGWIAEQLEPMKGQLSKKALASRRQTLTERWLGLHLDLRLPTRTGWQDLRGLT